MKKRLFNIFYISIILLSLSAEQCNCNSGSETKKNQDSKSDLKEKDENQPKGNTSNEESALGEKNQDNSSSDSNIKNNKENSPAVFLTLDECERKKFLINYDYDNLDPLMDSILALDDQEKINQILSEIIICRKNDLKKIATDFCNAIQKAQKDYKKINSILHALLNNNIENSFVDMTQTIDQKSLDKLSIYLPTIYDETKRTALLKNLAKHNLEQTLVFMFANNNDAPEFFQHLLLTIPMEERNELYGLMKRIFQVEGFGLLFEPFFEKNYNKLLTTNQIEKDPTFEQVAFLFKLQEEEKRQQQEEERQKLIVDLEV